MLTNDLAIPSGLSVYPKATGMVTALNQDVITKNWNPKSQWMCRTL